MTEWYYGKCWIAKLKIFLQLEIFYYHLGKPWWQHCQLCELRKISNWENMGDFPFKDLFKLLLG